MKRKLLLAACTITLLAASNADAHVSDNDNVVMRYQHEGEDPDDECITEEVVEDDKDKLNYMHGHWSLPVEPDAYPWYKANEDLLDNYIPADLIQGLLNHIYNVTFDGTDSTKYYIYFRDVKTDALIVSYVLI